MDTSMQPNKEMFQVFEEFKQTNDQNEKEIKKLKSADVVIEEKIDRLSQALDSFQNINQRPNLAAKSSFHAASDWNKLEHKAAFETYMRSGQGEALRGFEAKAMNGMLAPDMGYLLPPEAEANVLRRMASLSPIRSIASVRNLAGNSMKKAVYPSGANAGWGMQNTPTNSVSANQYTELSFPTMELFAQPAATQTMLDDAAVDIESWIGDEIEFAFSSAESTAFISGDGVNKPKGLLSYPTIADSSWSWGNMGVYSTGVAGAFPASNPSDLLIDFVHNLKSTYRQNASFVMNRKTQSIIRKFKDSTGNYLWAPPAVVGARPTLMNFPVVEAEDMPDVAANSLSIAFGDFRRGYLVLDRMGIRTLRDPYSTKPYVLFYTTKRVGGGVQDFAAIKLLKFGV